MKHGRRPAKKPRVKGGPTLPLDLWSAVLSMLPKDDVVNAACCSRMLAEAAGCCWTGVALDVLRDCRRGSWPGGLRRVLLLAGADQARLSTILASLDEVNTDLGDVAAARVNKVTMIAPALRALVNGLPPRRPGAPSRPLELALAVPSMRVATRQLERVLEASKAAQLVSEVEVVKGMASLDGALQDKLVRANVQASGLTPWLKVGTQLCLKVSGAADAASLGCLLAASARSVLDPGWGPWQLPWPLHTRAFSVRRLSVFP